MPAQGRALRFVMASDDICLMWEKKKVLPESQPAFTGFIHAAVNKNSCFNLSHPSLRLF